MRKLILSLLAAGTLAFGAVSANAAMPSSSAPAEAGTPPLEQVRHEGRRHRHHHHHGRRHRHLHHHHHGRHHSRHHRRHHHHHHHHRRHHHH